MNLFGFGNKNIQCEQLKKLVKERQKKEKELNKKWSDKAKLKYSQENLKTARKTMESEAMTIDSLEYEKLTQELKARLEKSKMQ